MRIGSHQRIGERNQLAVLWLGAHDAGQVLEVHLVHDAGARRHDAEVAKRLLCPLEQTVALAVPLHLARDVQLERRRRAEEIHLDRVVDHQVGLHERVDLVRVASQGDDRVAHRC